MVNRGDNRYNLVGGLQLGNNPVVVSELSGRSRSMVEPGFGFVDILLIPLVVLIGLVVIVVRVVLFFGSGLILQRYVRAANDYNL
jgi:hypothetical protein